MNSDPWSSWVDASDESISDDDVFETCVAEEDRISYLSAVGTELSQCLGERQVCQHTVGDTEPCADDQWSGSGFAASACAECRVRWNNNVTLAYQCDLEAQYRRYEDVLPSKCAYCQWTGDYTFESCLEEQDILFWQSEGTSLDAFAASVTEDTAATTCVSQVQFGSRLNLGAWETDGEYLFSDCVELRTRIAYDGRTSDVCESERQFSDKTVGRFGSSPWTGWTGSFYYEDCCQTELRMLWQDQNVCGGDPCVGGVFAPCLGDETPEDSPFQTCTATQTRVRWEPNSQGACQPEDQTRSRIGQFGFSAWSGTYSLDDCTDTEIRDWYVDYYASECVQEHQARSRVNGGAFGEWNGTALFPVCIPTEETVTTETRTYWQADVVEAGDTADDAASLCISGTQKRQTGETTAFTQWFGSYSFAQCIHVQTRTRWSSAGDSEARCEFEIQKRTSTDSAAFTGWSGNFAEETCVQNQLVTRYEAPIVDSTDDASLVCVYSQSLRTRTNNGPWQPFQSAGDEAQYFYNECVELQRRQRSFAPLMNGTCVDEWQYRERKPNAEWQAWSGSFLWASCSTMAECTDELVEDCIPQSGLVLETRVRYLADTATMPAGCVAEPQARAQLVAGGEWTVDWQSDVGEYTADTCTATERRTRWTDDHPTCDEVDLASTASIVASSSFSSQTAPENVMDGNTVTIWHTAEGDTSNQITFALPQRSVVSELVIKGVSTGPSYSFQSVTVERSIDGETWSTVRTADNATELSCSANRVDRLPGWPQFTSQIRLTLGAPCGDFFAVAEIQIMADCAYDLSGSGTCDNLAEVQQRQFTYNAGTEESVSDWGLCDDASDTSCEGSATESTFDECTQIQTVFLFPAAVAEVCEGRYRSHSLSSITGMWSTWSGDPDPIDTCSTSEEELAPYTFDTCLEVQSKDMYESAVPPTGQCVAQAQSRSREVTAELSASDWGSATGWAAGDDTITGVYGDGMYTAGGCLTQSVISGLVGDIQSREGSMSTSIYCQTVGSLTDIMGDFGESSEVPFEIACRAAGGFCMSAFDDAPGILDTLESVSRELNYPADCACDLLRVVNAMIQGISTMDATSAGVADVAEDLHARAVGIIMRASTGLTTGLGTFECDAGGMVVTAVKASASGNGLANIGLEDLTFASGAVPSGQTVLGSRIMYSGLPPAVRGCAKLFGCNANSLDGGRQASALADGDTIASQVAVYTLMSSGVQQDLSDSADLAGALDGTVNYRVALSDDVAFTPGLIFACQYWGATDSGYDWVVQPDCTPTRILSGEVLCSCGTADSTTLVGSGFLAQTPSSCAQHTTCSACKEDSVCGWCNSNAQCVEGNSYGPFGSESCDGWVREKCPVEGMTLAMSGTTSGTVIEESLRDELITNIQITDPDDVPEDGYNFERLDDLSLHMVGPEDEAGLEEDGTIYKFVVGLVGIPLYRDVPSLDVTLAVTDDTGIPFQQTFTFDVLARPTDILLSNNTAAERMPEGIAIGTLSAEDPDVADRPRNDLGGTHVFALGSGDTAFDGRGQHHHC